MSKNLSRKMFRDAQKAIEKGDMVPVLQGLKPDGDKSLPPNRPVSVVMIVKDCAEGLEKCLLSLRQKFVLPCDEILVVDTGSQDGGATVKVARKYFAKVIERPDLRVNMKPFCQKWMPELLTRFSFTGLAEGSIIDFAAARQIATDAAAHDIQFWIDSDDTLEEANPGRLRYAVNRYFPRGAEEIDQIFMDYHYAHSEDGSVSSILKRERIIDRRKSYWKGRCHETAIPKDGSAFKSAYFHDLGSYIRHFKAPDDRGEVNPSDIRNYIILKKEMEESEPSPDPRTIFYMANAARGVGHDAEAIELYQRFIPISGNRDDVYAAHYYIGTTYAGPKARRPIDALDWYFKCLQVKPEDPRGYFGIQRAYFQLGRWNEANHWYHCGRRLPEPINQLHNYDPRHIKVLPLQVLALTAKEQGDKEGAIQAVNELTAVAPKHPETEQVQQVVGNWLAGLGLQESVSRIIQNAAQGTPMGPDVAIKLGRQITEMLPAVPEEIENQGMAKLEPADTREGRDLMIFCGKAPEAWGPRSGELGIGGSEKAVIMMAPRLQRLGYRVTVYCNVPSDQRGIDKQTGVNWQHFGAMELKRPRDIAIFWRAPEMLEMPIPAHKRILWCHDVQQAGRWTRPRTALADQVWMLSKFHTTTLPQWVIDELGDRLVVTRNGIDGNLFKEALQLAGGRRNTKKIIYASSPDRGVMSAIRIFQAANIPGSQLDIFYGFNKLYLDNAARYEYAHIPDLGQETNLYRYMQSVLHAIDHDERIVMHGRVGWSELAAEMVTAGVWLYPTRFPEISCMSAMEAQAAGCVPVCTDYGALAETVLDKSFKITPTIDSSVILFNATQRSADDPERKILSEVACRAFDYDALAKEWDALLKKPY